MKNITKTIMYLQMTALFLTAALAGPAAAEKEVPFRGSIQAVETFDVQFPTLFSHGSGTGQATHLGRFAVTYEFEVNIPTATGTGPAHFVAANGDSLFTEVSGLGNPTDDPDMSFIISATEHLSKYMHKGMVVVLESTTYPGTTREVLLPKLGAERGLTVGEDWFLAFSPERVDPGRTDWTTKNTPKVVGGVTEDCTRVVAALYQPAIETIVQVSSIETAELVKLLENTFRSVNIGLVNEMAIVCDKLGVDVWEVIDAAATKPFGFMKFTPGPGVGGHCIPCDPHYLLWQLRRDPAWLLAVGFYAAKLRPARGPLGLRRWLRPAR
jgi:hypothetical protein